MTIQEDRLRKRKERLENLRKQKEARVEFLTSSDNSTLQEIVAQKENEKKQLLPPLPFSKPTYRPRKYITGHIILLIVLYFIFTGAVKRYLLGSFLLKLHFLLVAICLFLYLPFSQFYETLK